MIYPMMLIPVFKEYIWGGINLKQKYGKITTLKTIAESWELSCHKDGVSVIANGEMAGQRLDSYIQEYGRTVLGTKCKNLELPLLVKLIDTADNLSIQVHPDNEYARKYENQPGKKEMWYIVDCIPGSTLFYGFKRKISKEEFIKRALDGTITDVLNCVAVKPGDVFFIDSGTVHAIGKGMTVAEVGNNCNITYRIFDFLRKDKEGNTRELHLEKAADVAQLDVPIQYAFNESGVLNCKDFVVQEIKLNGTKELYADSESFHSILCIGGNCVLKYDGHDTQIVPGTSLFLPAGMGKYTLQGDALLLKTTI